ncbi:nitronate monooxygenase, partial [bacterium]|nr:nitronate monooxygenase [bacterium]
MRSRILELFGIERPIVGAGMIHVSTAGWAAAVADAGALGLIAGGHNTPESLRAEIRLAREMTRGALGVNVPLLYKHAPDLLRVCVEEDVRIVFTSAGNPAKVTPLLKSAGIINVHVVPSVRLAQKSVEAGVDAVVAEGYEAGGHVSRDGPTTLVLTRAVARAVEVPVIAAGGIADGAGVA